MNEGRRIIVFGRVEQFDPTTGPAFFLAYPGFDRRTAEASYDVFAALAGDEDMLFDVVQHDVFKAYVTVLGTYEGSRVLPKFQVDRIEVIKSA